MQILRSFQICRVRNPPLAGREAAFLFAAPDEPAHPGSLNFVSIFYQGKKGKVGTNKIKLSLKTGYQYQQVLIKASTLPNQAITSPNK